MSNPRRRVPQQEGVRRTDPPIPSPPFKSFRNVSSSAEPYSFHARPSLVYFAKHHNALHLSQSFLHFHAKRSFWTSSSPSASTATRQSYKRTFVIALPMCRRSPLSSIAYQRGLSLEVCRSHPVSWRRLGWSVTTGYEGMFRSLS